MAAETGRFLTFTFDLEDHRPITLKGRRINKRFPIMTHKVLDFLYDRNIRGTFFTVGQLAGTDAELIRDIVAGGHEIACHSYDHTPIPLQTRARFTEHTHKAKALLEDVTGQEVIGYRAPTFSLVADTLWATEVLHELGFVYSSSVLPAKSPLYGFPNVPTSPYLWENGLLELPSPVASFGPFRLPYLGGIYFRYLPASLINNALLNSNSDSCKWHYSHPYDYDPDERFFVIKGATFWASVLLWFNRQGTFDKLDALAQACPDMAFDIPFRDQIKQNRFASAARISSQTTAG